MPLYLTCNINNVIEIDSPDGKIILMIQRQKCSRNNVRIGIDAPAAYSIKRGSRKEYDDDRETSLVNNS